MLPILFCVMHTLRIITLRYFAICIIVIIAIIIVVVLLLLLGLFHRLRPQQVHLHSGDILLAQSIINRDSVVRLVCLCLSCICLEECVDLSQPVRKYE